MGFLIIPELSEAMQAVDAELTRLLASLEQYPQVRPILADVRASRGKQIRPQLLLLSAGKASAAASGSAGDAGKIAFGSSAARGSAAGVDHALAARDLYRLAALVEMVHMASLVHDDIVDDSPLRRGRPTIQSRFGKDMAVYTGDLLLARVMQALFEENLTAYGADFARTIARMCAGEIGQYGCSYALDTSVEQYLDNISGKTAALFSLSCRLGALASGSETQVTETLTRFGQKLGLLFQIRDDMLDFSASPETDGKPAGMDFRSGILTLPVLYALESEAFRPRLRQLMLKAQSSGWESADAEELQEVLRASGGMQKARDKARALGDELCELLASLPEGVGRARLEQLKRKLIIE